jgi:plastocyanin
MLSSSATRTNKANKVQGERFAPGPGSAMRHAAPTCRVGRGRACLVALALLSALPAVSGTLTVTARQRDDRPLAGAVITVEAESPEQPPAPPVQAIMDQMDLAFVPDVLVIPVHSSVQFPNSDAVSHQVYSFSSARTFQLPLYRGKPYPPVVFDRPGVITLGCNIHDNMLAYIVVTRAAHFGRTDTNGAWSVANLPGGRYRVRLWHPLLNEAAEVSGIVTDAADALELKLRRNLRPAPITGRPHSWDY